MQEHVGKHMHTHMHAHFIRCSRLYLRTKSYLMKPQHMGSICRSLSPLDLFCPEVLPLRAWWWLLSLPTGGTCCMLGDWLKMAFISPSGVVLGLSCMVPSLGPPLCILPHRPHSSMCSLLYIGMTCSSNNTPGMLKSEALFFPLILYSHMLNHPVKRHNETHCLV